MKKRGLIRWGILGGIMLLSVWAYTQSIPKGISLEPSLYFGKIVKHTSKFTTPINGYTTGGELNIGIQTYGKRDWHEAQKLPVFGLAFSYLNFGDKEIFGTGVGLMPNLNLRFLKRKRFYGDFRFGVGLAWLNRPFNYASNPTNNAIGSNLNTIVGFRFGTNWIINEHWTTLAAVSLTHYSNAASSLPNLGINIPALNLGVRYTPQPLMEADYVRTGRSPEFDKRFHLGIYQGLGIKESQAFAGPKYPVYVSRLSVHRRLKHNNRLYAGFEYEYAMHVLAFTQHIGLFETEKERRKNAQRAMLFIADEVSFGRVSLWLQAGTYMTRSYLQPWFLYTRLGIRYYPFIARKGHPRIHIGLYMKSHKEVAEYVDYGIGITF